MRQFAKTVGFRILRALKRTNGDFIVIARIDKENIITRNQGVPVGWIDIGARLIGGIDTVNTKCDDFLLSRTFIR